MDTKFKKSNTLGHGLKLHKLQCSLVRTSDTSPPLMTNLRHQPCYDYNKECTLGSTTSTITTNNHNIIIIINERLETRI